MVQPDAEYSDQNHKVHSIREQVSVICVELKRCAIQLK